jgi:hypothetical protein
LHEGSVQTEYAHVYKHNRSGTPRPDFHPEEISGQIRAAGWSPVESSVLALAVYATLASPANESDLERIASAAARIGDVDTVLEMAGVVFAFNVVNRVADARRVPLEYRVLREMKPVRKCVERGFAVAIGLLYDLTYAHHPRHSPDDLLRRLDSIFERLGAPATPVVFQSLRRLPTVLEGICEMVEVNATVTETRGDLWKEAVAIAIKSRAMSGSCLIPVVDHWLSRASLMDSRTLHSRASSQIVECHPSLASACRRYARRVANASYSVTDDTIREIRSLGLSDADVLDLTLGAALFSGLAIIEPLVITRNTAPETEFNPNCDGPSNTLHSTPL